MLLNNVVPGGGLDGSRNSAHPWEERAEVYEKSTVSDPAQIGKKLVAKMSQGPGSDPRAPEASLLVGELIAHRKKAYEDTGEPDVAKNSECSYEKRSSRKDCSPAAS